MIENDELSADLMRPDQDYDARGVIACIGSVGNYMSAGREFNIPAYVTLDCGDKNPSICARFIRQAESKNGFVNMADLVVGDIIVKPGFIYRKCPWTTPLINAHLAALKKYRRKVIVKAEKDDAPATDVIIDPYNLTKQ